MTYGDYDNVTKDATALRDILARQGSPILFEVLADQLAEVTTRHNLNSAEVQTALNKQVADYTSLINDRT